MMGNSGSFKPGHKVSSKYNAEHAERMIRYFTNEGGFPTFEMFAASIGVIAETLRNWAEKYKKFGEAYERCLDIQKGRLISGAVAGDYNATFAKFVAVNCHGMRDKVETDIGAEEGFEVNINVEKQQS